MDLLAFAKNIADRVKRESGADQGTCCRLCYRHSRQCRSQTPHERSADLLIELRA